MFEQPELMADGSSRSGLSQKVVREIVRERAEALAEVERLREALESEWQSNHSEHCRGLVNGACPLGDRCHWPRPEVLLGTRPGEEADA